jgi:predicted HNH restriction endonuclease
MSRQKILAPNRWRHSLVNRRTFGTFQIPDRVRKTCNARDGEKRNVTFVTQKGKQFTLEASIASGWELLLPKRFHATIEGNEYVEITINDFILDNLTNSQLLPDIEEVFEEGRIVLRTHLERERNHGLVNLVKEKTLLTEGEFRCGVCKFSFEECYGDIGSGFIEAHHLVPIFQRTASTRVRLEDFALLCSNCHRMIHKGNPVFSLEELRNKLR